MGDVRYRAAVAGDVAFLATMLGEAAVWRPDKPTPSGDEVMADPRYAMYLAGWPRPGDVGLVAEQDEPVGAAWYRTYTEADHGHGFLAEEVPELSIAVIGSRRREGIGRRLLVDLIQASVAQGHAADQPQRPGGQPGAPPLRVDGLRAGRQARNVLEDDPTRRSTWSRRSSIGLLRAPRPSTRGSVLGRTGFSSAIVGSVRGMGNGELSGKVAIVTGGAAASAGRPPSCSSPRARGS